MEDENAARRPTARSLPIALLRAREVVMSPIRPLLAEAGVTEAQWRVLRVLDENGPLDPARTAREACVLLPSLTRIVRDLEARGLIQREPHQTDKRTFWLNVSDDARDLIARHLAQSADIFDEIEGRFGPERLAELMRLLDALQDARLPDQATATSGSESKP